MKIAHSPTYQLTHHHRHHHHHHHHPRPPHQHLTTHQFPASLHIHLPPNPLPHICIAPSPSFHFHFNTNSATPWAVAPASKTKKGYKKFNSCKNKKNKSKHNWKGKAFSCPKEKARWRLAIQRKKRNSLVQRHLLNKNPNPRFAGRGLGKMKGLANRWQNSITTIDSLSCIWIIWMDCWGKVLAPKRKGTGVTAAASMGAKEKVSSVTRCKWDQCVVNPIRCTRYTSSMVVKER
jgi:hypothetical protein